MAIKTSSNGRINEWNRFSLGHGGLPSMARWAREETFMIYFATNQGDITKNRKSESASILNHFFPFVSNQANVILIVQIEQICFKWLFLNVFLFFCLFYIFVKRENNSKQVGCRQPEWKCR
jgi:hypothetical protein